MKMKYYDVDGVATRCIVSGDENSPPLLLIHGISLTADIWLRNMDELGRYFHVVAVDMLGHGFTRPLNVEQPVTIGAKIAHLSKLVDLLGFEQFFVSGSSFGGLVGANLYFSEKDRITKLIINGSGSSFNSKEQLNEFISVIYEKYKPVVTDASPEKWRGVLKSSFYNSELIPNEVTMLLCLCYAQPWAEVCWEQTINSVRDTEAFEPFRILERLEEIEVDSLVVWGREDRGAVHQNAVSAVSRMPSARLVSFDECGHLPMVECPKTYNHVVKEFLTTV